MDSLQDVLKKSFFSLNVKAVSIDVVLGNPFENARRIVSFVNSYDRRNEIIIFQELCLTGSSCASLFFDESFIETTLEALFWLVKNIYSTSIVCVGLPLKVESFLYNCIVVIQHENILCVNVLPPNEYSYKGFKRYEGEAESILLEDKSNTYNKFIEVPFGSNILLNLNMTGEIEWQKILKVGFLTDNLISEASFYDICLLFSSSPFILQNYFSQNEVCKSFSKVYGNAIVFSGRSYTENDHHWIYSNEVAVFEDGKCISEKSIVNEKNGLEYAYVDVSLDIEHICKTRKEGRKNILEITADIDSHYGYDYGSVSRLPFISSFENPSDEKINKYIECLFSIETKAIRYHLKSIGIEKCVLGVSGGIDSTVALLFLIGCFKTEKDRKNIYAFSLPCFGTTEKTKQNALSLCNLLGCNIEEIDIKDSVLQHFRDIGQDSNNYDVTFENAQARERSQVLMDKANMLGAIFIGSSDISEIALGFSTYAGDHMSMYNILGSIPKTVLRLFLEYAIKNPKFFVIKKEDESSFKAIITSVLETPISPELLPHKDGNIVQKTESLLGSYELHDFFIYHIFQNHYSLKKVLYLTIKAFGYTYSEKVIVEQLKLFYKRFFANQFKRNCAPECPNVTGFSFANWELPSNIPYSLYLKEFKEIEKYIHT